MGNNLQLGDSYHTAQSVINRWPELERGTAISPQQAQCDTTLDGMSRHKARTENISSVAYWDEGSS